MIPSPLYTGQTYLIKNYVHKYMTEQAFDLWWSATHDLMICNEKNHMVQYAYGYHLDRVYLHGQFLYISENEKF